MAATPSPRHGTRGWSRGVGLQHKTVARALGSLLLGMALLGSSCTGPARRLLGRKMEEPVTRLGDWLNPRNLGRQWQDRMAAGQSSFGRIVAAERRHARGLREQVAILQPGIQGRPGQAFDSLLGIAGSELDRTEGLRDRVMLRDENYGNLLQPQRQVRRLRLALDNLPHILGLDIVILAGPGSPRLRVDPDLPPQSQPLDERFLRRLLP